MWPFPKAVGFELLASAESNLSPDVFGVLEAEVALTMCHVQLIFSARFISLSKPNSSKRMKGHSLVFEMCGLLLGDDKNTFFTNIYK